MKRALAAFTAMVFVAATAAPAFGQGGEPSPPRQDVKGGKKANPSPTPNPDTNKPPSTKLKDVGYEPKR